MTIVVFICLGAIHFFSAFHALLHYGIQDYNRLKVRLFSWISPKKVLMFLLRVVLSLFRTSIANFLWCDWSKFWQAKSSLFPQFSSWCLPNLCRQKMVGRWPFTDKVDLPGGLWKTHGQTYFFNLLYLLVKYITLTPTMEYTRSLTNMDLYHISRLLNQSILL